MSICKVLFVLIRGLFVSRSNLIIENLALRQQLTVQQRTIKRPKLKRKDRIFWAWLSRIWPQWKSALIVVKPEIVIKWHRQGFKLYWHWKLFVLKPQRRMIVNSDSLNCLKQGQVYVMIGSFGTIGHVHLIHKTTLCHLFKILGCFSKVGLQ